MGKNNAVVRSKQPRNAKNTIEKLTDIKMTLNKICNKNDETIFWEKLLKRALEIISDADYGITYQYKEGKIQFIEAVGHNINILKKDYFNLQKEKIKQQL